MRVGADKRLTWHGRGRAGQYILLGNPTAGTGTADLAEIDAEFASKPAHHRRDEPQRRRVHRSGLLIAKHPYGTPDPCLLTPVS